MTSRRHFVFLTQVYPPDPAAVGQHLADAAEELARRGHKVSVFTADRGFDDPSMKFVSREHRSGVDVRRLPFGSFGKSSIVARVASGIVLMFQELAHGLAVADLDTVVVTTSPPVGPMAGVVLSALKDATLKYWVMDVNPDQMVALGKLRSDSVLARVFGWMNGIALKRASAIIVLDRMMARLIEKKANVANRMTVVRPWAAD
ncbi:MAG: glycosyltransferase, partial [Thermoanaerobaculia bacterium]